MMDFFHTEIKYRNPSFGEILPFGVLWTYIDSTFLNAFINYVSPVCCFALDQYHHPHTEVTAKCWDLQGKQIVFSGAKIELIRNIQESVFRFMHTELSMFKDTCVLIGKIPNGTVTNLGEYIFFWFDPDVSDCKIGRFQHKEETKIMKELKIELETLRRQEDITGYYQLPTNYLRGWVKF